MDYVYEGVIENIDGDWLITVPQFDGCFGGGRTIKKAAQNAAEALRLFIADYLDNDRKLPRSVFSKQPGVVLCVEVDDNYIQRSKCMTASEAAETLDISRGRVTQLTKAGLLDSVIIDGKRMVTIASVNERKANPPASHRPRMDDGKD